MKKEFDNSKLKINSKPKVVAMDVDGTLVPHGGTVGVHTRQVLEKAKSLGIEIVLVTARPPRWLGRVVDALGISSIAICANGAITVDTSSFEVLDIINIEKTTALGVVRQIKELVPDVVFAAETAKALKAGPGYQDLPEGVKQAEGLVPRNRYDSIEYVENYEDIFSEKVYKIVAETFELDADEFLKIASEAVGSQVSVTRSVKGRSYIEFGPLNLSKADTLSKHVDELGYTKEDVIAFGDMLNDIDMLEWSGYGVAMENAHEKVKKVADFVAPSADDDGIAIVLEEILRKFTE